MGNRKCSRCKEIKLTSDFYARGKNLASICKECQKFLSKQYWTKKYSSDPEPYRERARSSYHKGDKDKIKQVVRSWQENNPEKRRAIQKRYDSTHLMQRANNENRRRARKKSSFIEPYDRLDIYNLHSGVCYLCGEIIDLNLSHPHSMSFSIDHTIPLALGGADAPHNVVPAHLQCNIRKGIGKNGLLS